MPKIGILALQGASALHAEAVTFLGAHPVEVRRPEDLTCVDAVILPGGESTTLARLLASSGLDEVLAEGLADGLPAFGTCAGMILLASQILDGRPGQRCFGAIDVAVRRNAFGSQVDSFEAAVAVDGLVGGDFPATFIRAPVVERVGDGVEVVATVAAPDGSRRPVLCRQGPVLVAAFHPELSDDLRLHQSFLSSL
ncbi:MAG: pyridoxal 5'-phosphate synthase glutaminase subunit PdxT [Acidimicrobiia bacterium]|nr:pyridoxal 5'-phosphate synthase glutaminase subunit PdxT [Acidimicrobiia bacterium]